MERHLMGWERWNLAQNPFNPRPLETTKELKELFIGREKELTELRKILFSPDARVVVEADVGAGKTTFVYRVFSELFDKKEFLIMLPTIKLGPYTSGPDIKSCVALALVNALDRLQKSHKFNRKQKNKLRDVISRSREFKTLTLQLGASLFPPGPAVGVGFGARGRVERLAPLGSLAESLFHEVSELLPQLELRGAVFALNNFDTIQEELLEDILQDIRELVFTRNFSFVLLGGKGFYEKTQSFRRWMGVFTAFPIRLEPFSKKTMLEIINRRINFYSLPNKKPICPATPQLLEYLCDLAGDNLRWLLFTISALGNHFLDMPVTGEQIDVAEAKLFLKMQAFRKLESLPHGLQKILKKMIEYGNETYSADREFLRFANCTQPWFYRALKELESGEHLLKRYEGRKVLFSVGPDYRVLAPKRSGKLKLAKPRGDTR